MSLLPVAAASTSAQTSTMQLQRAGTMYAAGNFVQALRRARLEPLSQSLSQHLSQSLSPKGLRRARLEPLSQSLSQPAKMSHRHHLVTWIIQYATVRAEISYCCSLRNYPRQLQEGAQLLNTYLFCYKQLLSWSRDVQRMQPTGTRCQRRTVLSATPGQDRTGDLQHVGLTS